MPRRGIVKKDSLVRSIRNLFLHYAVLTSGSRGADLHNDGMSDFDLVIIAPSNDRATVFEQIGIILCSAGIGHVQVLRNAFTPLIKVEHVDIIVAAIQPECFHKEDWVSNWNRHPRTIPEMNYSAIDEISLRSINSLRMCSLLGSQPESFKVVVRDVKQWARKRAIYGATLGFWGGVAWSLFVYYTKPSSLREALLTLCTHPWPQPIGTEIDDGASTDSMCTILTPFHPTINTTHACCLPTLREMILLAEETLQNPYQQDDALSLIRHFHHYAMITCSPNDRELVMARARHLIPSMEQPQVFVRPRAYFSGLNVMTFGLEPLPGAWTEEVKQKIIDEVREWCERMDVEVMVSVV